VGMIFSRVPLPKVCRLNSGVVGDKDVTISGCKRKGGLNRNGGRVSGGDKQKTVQVKGLKVLGNREAYYHGKKKLIGRERRRSSPGGEKVWGDEG